MTPLTNQNSAPDIKHQRTLMMIMNWSSAKDAHENGTCFVPGMPCFLKFQQISVQTILATACTALIGQIVTK
jgi:hypothetical protein